MGIRIQYLFHINGLCPNFSDKWMALAKQLVYICTRGNLLLSNTFNSLCRVSASSAEEGRLQYTRTQFLYDELIVQKMLNNDD